MKIKLVTLLLAALMLLSGALIPALSEDMPMIEWNTGAASADLLPEEPAYTAGKGVTVSAVSLTGRVVFNELCDSMMYKAADSACYALISADGEMLTDAVYTDAEYLYYASGFIVSAADTDPMRSKGLIDDAGRIVVPARYAKIRYISDRWLLAEMATVAGENDPVDFIVYDRETGKRKNCIISGVDVYYRGALIGTLSRDSYSTDRTEAYGDYICIKNAHGRCIYYNKTLTPSSFVDENTYPNEYGREYQDGKTILTHKGTNQKAFVSGCTLSADEVQDVLLYDYSSYSVLNLQGKTVYQANASDGFSLNGRYGDHYLFSMNNCYGLMDLKGNIVIPAKYTRINTPYHDRCFRNGYISVDSENAFGYLDASGRMTCPIRFSNDYDHYYFRTSTFAAVENLDGTQTVISAASGPLPETYASVNYNSESSSVYCAKRLDGTWTVNDLHGNVLLAIANARGISANRDGTMVLATMSLNNDADGPNRYVLYHLRY